MGLTVKKAAATLLWTVAFYWAGVVVYGALGGLWAGLRIRLGYSVESTTEIARWMGAHRLVLVVPTVVAATTFVLCIFGNAMRHSGC